MQRIYKCIHVTLFFPEKLQSSKRYSKISLAISEASNSSHVTVPVLNGGSQVVLTHLPGDQCTSTKRKKRKQKVKSNVSDTLVFVGRNMNVLWSSLKQKPTEAKGTKISLNAALFLVVSVIHVVGVKVREGILHTGPCRCTNYIKIVNILSVEHFLIDLDMPK